MTLDPYTDASSALVRFFEHGAACSDGETALSTLRKLFSEDEDVSTDAHTALRTALERTDRLWTALSRDWLPHPPHPA